MLLIRIFNKANVCALTKKKKKVTWYLVEKKIMKFNKETFKLTAYARLDM